MPRKCNSSVNKPKREKVSSMAETEKKAVERKIEVIEIDDSCPSPDDGNFSPLRPVLCLKNRNQIKKFEEKEECFILEFDPYDDLDILKKSCSNGADNDEADLSVLAVKGKVACRDYPHPRHSCAKYPFESTSHDKHCELCFCFVCDSAAPCSKWVGLSGHCHAFNNEAWTVLKQQRRRKIEST